MNGHLSFIEVEDIIQNSGADKLRVYPALFELGTSGFLEWWNGKSLEHLDSQEKEKRINDR